jgi:SAM-dependent methyltransferase
MPSVRNFLRPYVKWWFRSGHRVQLTKDLEPVINRLTGVVLDVGGGRSAPHDGFFNQTVRRIRIDISPRQRPDVIADAAALPFRDGSADGVVMCEVLEHLREPKIAISEAARALSNGGVLCGSVPFIMPIHGAPDDYYRYTASGLRHLLDGFGSVQIIPHGNFVGGAWKLLRNRYRFLVPLNPLSRRLSAKADGRCPEGYTFIATR